MNMMLRSFETKLSFFNWKLGKNICLWQIQTTIHLFQLVFVKEQTNLINIETMTLKQISAISIWWFKSLIWTLCFLFWNLHFYFLIWKKMWKKHYFSFRYVSNIIQYCTHEKYKKINNSDVQADNSKQTQREKVNSHRNLYVIAI